METTIKIDQNRSDFCVFLVNNGFIHIGRIWGKYDIYYNPEDYYTYEVDFPNTIGEYRITEYVGEHRREHGN